MDNLIFSEKIARRKTKFRSPLQNQIEQRYAEKIMRSYITNESRLSDRENAISVYLAKCCEVDAIADRLSISPETVVTHRKNMANRNPWGESKYLGVSFSIVAQIQINKQKYYLGLCKTEEQAAKRYDAAAKYFIGEFANLNFK